MTDKTMNKGLVKVYGDKKYVATAMVRHEGTTVAFAMDADRRMFYSVLYMDQFDRAKGDLDAAYWGRDPAGVPFPSEIVDSGAAVHGALTVPSVKKGGRAEVAADLLFPGEGDGFLSSTARLSAAAPFQVVSDGRYILLFRQSVAATHADALFELKSGDLTGDSTHKDLVLAGGQKSAVVDGSLLCDRFVLVGSELRPVLEVRYQRSRRKLQPATGGDTLGTRDMNGAQFYEPTQKVSFVRPLANGSFAVLLLPTAVSGVQRWQIFAANESTGRIDSFSLDQSAEGLFDVEGAQLYTSPDPKFARSVLERAPGLDPHTGRELVPVVASTDRAGTALRFDTARGGHVLLADGSAGEPVNAAFTAEAWVRPKTLGGVFLHCGDGGRKNGFRLGLDTTGHLVVKGVTTAWTLTSSAVLRTGVFAHAAVIFDGAKVTLVLDGVVVASTPSTVVPDVLTATTLGAGWDNAKAVEGFTGDLDEVRIWRVARSLSELVDRGRRLTGVEPGLAAYYRLDEGTGTSLANLVSSKCAGTIEGGVEWVGSNAPVGDGPGLSRDTFAFAGRKVVSGLAATLYYQQEPGQAGYGSAPSQEKRQGRVLLACATSGPAPQGGKAERSYLSTVDFAMAADGRLAAAPPTITLPAIGLPNPTEAMDKLSEAQAKVSAAQGRLSSDTELARRASHTQTLIDEIDRKIGVGVPGSLHELNHWFWHVRPGEREYERKLLEEKSGYLVQLAEQAAAEKRLGADKEALAAARDALATLSGGKSGGPESVLAMPAHSVDRAGLSVFAALLLFAWSADAPTLMDSSTGDVVMYFRGGDGEFFSAYYAATVSRAAKAFTVTDGALELVARDTAVDLSDITITVAAVAAADRCDVVITRGKAKETFASVPRKADELAAVLNGQIKTGRLLGTVLSAQDEIVQLSLPLSAPLTKGTAVSIDGRIRTVSDSAQSGSTKFAVTTDGLGSSVGGEVHLALYDYANAASSVAGVSLKAGSQIVSADAGPATAPVGNGTATDVTAARVPRWRGATPGRALSFDGRQQFLSLPEANLSRAAVSGDLTVEAWAQPGAVESVSAILHADVPGSRYTLGMERNQPHSALRFDGKSRLECGDSLNLIDRDFTIEMWARRTESYREEVLFGHGSATAASNKCMHFGFINQDWFRFDFYDDRLDVQIPNDLNWHHWAVVYQTATRQRTLYRDGVQIGQNTSSNPRPFTGTGMTILGNSSWKGLPAKAALEEVRVWGKARTAAEINSTMRTRLGGQVPGLLAYWTFPEGNDVSGNGHNGTVVGDPVVAVESALGSDGYSVVGVVGDQVVTSVHGYPVGQWAHLAMSFEQSWAMRLGGEAYLDCGGPGGLDLVDDLTIEAYLKLDSIGVKQGLVSKGALRAGTPDAVPYCLYVEADGQLAFTCESGTGGAGTQKTFLSGYKLKPGTFTKVAVTRKVVLAGRTGIRFYINGKRVDNGGTIVETEPLVNDPLSYHFVDAAKPVGNDANVELGRYLVGALSYGLRGTLSQVRIWSVARDTDQIGVNIAANASGLTAWWTFPEHTGAASEDACGSYPATLRGAVRVPTPDPDGNRFTLYRNGAAVETKRNANTGTAAQTAVMLALFPQPATRVNQLTIAARKDSGGTAQGFTGTLDEIRVWRTARSHEQLLDNLFSRIRGERADLIAHYPLDPNSTVKGATVYDAGLAGLDLSPSTTAPEVVVSTAPISEDTCMVRSALTGVRTPFNVLTSATPAASEYADVQRIAHGQIIGVMKRAYTYVRDGEWVLTTGFKVGDLSTTWVGQAQFDPQLIGYIEGAPPVPSENMTSEGGSDFAEKASVTFVQADNVANTLASKKSDSVTMAAKGLFNLELGGEIMDVTAPLGFGTVQPLVKLKSELELTTELKYSNGWDHETQVQQTSGTTRSSGATLTGGWENPDPAKQANPSAGQRWIPNNTGFAIVTSETADVYALRLTHSGALVAYRMLPSPDIPRDWNIIPFPINAKYTKQGSLDGLIGYGKTGTSTELLPFPDPDFPRAATGTDDGGRREFSYFRPSEAYRLKKRIQREQQQLQGFYDSVSVETHTSDPTHGQAGKVLSGMMGGTDAPIPSTGDVAGGRAAIKSASRRNIANTYVWTAAGGFFSETHDSIDQVTEVTAGNYNVSGEVSFKAQFSSTTKAAGFKGGFEVKLGGGSTVTRTRTKATTRTYKLEVVCQPSRQLQKLNGTTPVFDADGKPVLVAGRVDAYRFMSFYLDTTTDNYEDFYGKVIDPEWLERSKDANANALRQARQATRKPPCWRILHRVTFVSRVLPATPPANASALDKALRAQNLASIYTLITQLEPHLKGATGTLADLTAATKTALAAHYPALTPHTEQITASLATYHQLPGAPHPALTTPTSKIAPTPPATSPITITKGSPLALTYSTPPETVSTKNWIGLYPAGKATYENAPAWAYAPNADGTVNITTTALTSGAYKAVYLHNDTYTPLADPLPFTIT